MLNTAKHLESPGLVQAALIWAVILLVMPACAKVRISHRRPPLRQIVIKVGEVATDCAFAMPQALVSAMKSHPKSRLFRETWRVANPHWTFNAAALYDRRLQTMTVSYQGFGGAGEGGDAKFSDMVGNYRLVSVTAESIRQLADESQKVNFRVETGGYVEGLPRYGARIAASKVNTRPWQSAQTAHVRN